MTRLTLGDLIDLEARTLGEQGESEEVRRTRYRQMGRRLLEKGPLPEDPGALLQGLIRLDPRPDAPGRRFESALRIFHALLVFLGLLAGGGVSLGLLHNSGPHPVNVLTFLAGLVGVQLVLLAALIVALIPRSGARSSGPVQHLLRAGLAGILRRAGAAERMESIGDRLDAHRGLLRWILIRAAQVFGVAFNVAALAGCLYRIAFTDIAFGWSTTLRLDAETVHRISGVLAAPWSWITSHGVPDLDLVRLTQYSHLEGKYLLHAGSGRSIGGAAVGDWWLFLVLALYFYGFLPRVLALTLAGFRLRGILAETPRQNGELARLCEWMRQPVLTTRAEGPDPAPPSPSPGAAASEAPLPPSGSTCEILKIDADLVAPERLDQLLRDRFGWTVTARVAPQDLSPDGRLPLVAVLPAWEEPTRGRLRPWIELRARLANRLLLVGLLDPSPKEADEDRLRKIRDRWKRELSASLDGVRVRVEALGPRP